MLWSLGDDGVKVLKALIQSDVLPFPVSDMVTSSDHCDELPLTLGRDFSGVVVDTGMSPGSFNVGDQVWGTVFPTNSRGSHAEYVLASTTNSVGLKPKSLSHVEAASIPYAALTAWSGLDLTGNLLGITSTPGIF